MMKILPFIALYVIVLISVRAYLPIIFIYLSAPAICNDPWRSRTFGYGRFALEQAILTQPNNTVLLVSNFAMCGRFATLVSTIKGLRLVDTSHIISQRTQTYMNLSRRIISVDNDTTELFLTSAQRFFILEDVMTSLKYHEAFHLELDNMLYENISKHLSILRGSYTALTATPLSHPNYGLTTASVFWVPRLDLLEKFNKFLLQLAAQGTVWMSYINWSRHHGGCCKRKGGLYSQKDGGGGLKPFFISEMSMLTYYRELYHDSTLFSFPILPYCGLYPTNRFVQNSTEYAVSGRKVGPPLGDYIFDPGSYGQFLGGTHRTYPTPGFTDGSHIVGQAFRLSNGISPECGVEMRCKGSTIHVSTSSVLIESSVSYPLNNVSARTRTGGSTGTGRNNASISTPNTRITRITTSTMSTGARSAGTGSAGTGSNHESTRTHSAGTGAGTGTSCWTAPFVRCKQTEPWVPLLNLHVHNKKTEMYSSRPCNCGI